MRYKGVLNIKGETQRVVFQGVHMLMGAERAGKWRSDEQRTSKMVFIGRDLPRELLEQGLAACAEPAKKTA